MKARRARSRVWALPKLSVVLLVWAVQLSAAVFNVKNAPYQARGDGETDDEPAIQAAIDAAAVAGAGNTVLIPAGRYCLKSASSDRHFYFHLPSTATDLTVTGEGDRTVLLSAAGLKPFVADRCENVTLQNLTVDFKTLNLTQGKITAVDAGARTVTVALDAGYPPPDDAIFSPGEKYERFFRVLATGRDTFDWTRQPAITSVVPAGDQWVFTLEKPLTEGEVGKRFFVWGNRQGAWMPFVSIRDCAGFTVKNVNDYAGGGFAGGGRSGTLTFTDFYCGPPPGSNRLGFYGGHQGHSRADVVMTRCVWLMSNDDCMNELTAMENILAHPAPDVIAIGRSSDYQVNDVISIWDYADARSPHVRENATIRDIRRNVGGHDELVLNKPVVIRKTGKGTGERPAWTDTADRVVNLSSGGSFRLIDCAFSASFAHPLLLKTAKGLYMEGCRIYGSDMSGLSSGMQTFWNEGPQTCNVTLKNNVFYDNDGISCLIGIEARDGPSAGSRDQRHIVIEGNTFLNGGNHPVWNGIMPRGVALLIGNVTDAVVKKNLFVGFPNANIIVYSSDQVAIDHNVFVDSHQVQVDSRQWNGTAKVEAGALLSISNASRVSIGQNISYNDGEHGTGFVAVGADTQAITGAGKTGVFRVRPTVYPATAALVNNAPCEETRADGYVSGFNRPGGAITFTVTMERDGFYPVVITYANPSVDSEGLGVAANQQLFVDRATTPMTVEYPYTGAWGLTNPMFKTLVWLSLKAGGNTLRFTPGAYHVGLHDIMVPGAILPEKPASP